MTSRLRAAGGDSTEVEVKSAAGGLPNSLTSTLSALANQLGGGTDDQLPHDQFEGPVVYVSRDLVLESRPSSPLALHELRQQAVGYVRPVGELALVQPSELAFGSDPRADMHTAHMPAAVLVTIAT